jgi:hypothetical protein
MITLKKSDTDSNVNDKLLFQRLSLINAMEDEVEYIIKSKIATKIWNPVFDNVDRKLLFLIVSHMNEIL